MTAKQFKAARAWLDLSQQDLAAETLVGRRAIQDLNWGIASLSLEHCATCARRWKREASNFYSSGTAPLAL